MVDARDLRENTRALIRLEKAVEALNKTIVDIERTRRAETQQDDITYLYMVCPYCTVKKCGSVEIPDPKCSCCKKNHILT